MTIVSTSKIQKDSIPNPLISKETMTIKKQMMKVHSNLPPHNAIFFSFAFHVKSSLFTDGGFLKVQIDNITYDLPISDQNQFRVLKNDDSIEPMLTEWRILGRIHHNESSLSLLASVRSNVPTSQRIWEVPDILVKFEFIEQEDKNNICFQANKLLLRPHQCICGSNDDEDKELCEYFEQKNIPSFLLYSNAGLNEQNLEPLQSGQNLRILHEEREMTERMLSAGLANRVIIYILKAAATIASIIYARIGGGLIGIGPIIFNKFIFFARYLDIDYPSNLADYYSEQISDASLCIEFNPSESAEENLPRQSLGGAFDDYGIHSYFLYNYWANLMSLLIILLAIVTLYTLSRFCGDFGGKWFEKFFGGFVNIMRWNFFLLLVCSSYDEIILFFILDIKTNTFDNFASVLSSIIAVAFLLILLLVLTLVLFAYLKLRKHRARVAIEGKPPEDPLETTFFSFKSLLTGFKEGSFLTQGFFCIFSLRTILNSVIIALLYESPVAQAILMALLNVFMIVVLLWKKPFKSLLNNIEYIFYEAFVGILHICLIILADGSKSEALGNVLIYGSTVFYIISIIFLAVHIFSGAKEFVKVLFSKSKEEESTPTPQPESNLNSPKGQQESTERNPNSVQNDDSTTLLNKQDNSQPTVMIKLQDIDDLEKVKSPKAMTSTHKVTFPTTPKTVPHNKSKFDDAQNYSFKKVSLISNADTPKTTIMDIPKSTRRLDGGGTTSIGNLNLKYDPGEVSLYSSRGLLNSPQNQSLEALDIDKGAVQSFSYFTNKLRSNTRTNTMLSKAEAIGSDDSSKDVTTIFIPDNIDKRDLNKKSIFATVQLD